jgi:hypothetical protein
MLSFEKKGALDTMRKVTYQTSVAASRRRPTYVVLVKFDECDCPRKEHVHVVAAFGSFKKAHECAEEWEGWVETAFDSRRPAKLSR